MDNDDRMQVLGTQKLLCVLGQLFFISLLIYLTSQVHQSDDYSVCKTSVPQQHCLWCRASVLTIAGPPGAPSSGMAVAVVLLQALQELGRVSSLWDVHHWGLLCCWLRLRWRSGGLADSKSGKIHRDEYREINT